MNFTERLAGFSALLVFLTASPAARAGVHTWGGAIGGSWSNAANWSAGGAPTAGETGLQLIFPANAANKTNTDNIPGLVVDLITISGGPYVFQGGNSAKLTLSGAGTSSIVNGSANSIQATIHSTLPVVLNGTCEIRVGSGFVEIDGGISGSGGLSIYGFVTLDGTMANTYTGTTNVPAGGSLALHKTAGLACFAGPLLIKGGGVNSITGNLIPDNQPITVSDGGSLSLSNGAETIGPLTLSNATLHFDTTNPVVTLGGTVTVSGNSQISGRFKLGSTARVIDIADAVSLTTTDPIGDPTSGSGGFVKTGLGTLELLGTNTFTGAANITAGTVFARNSAAFGTTAGGVTVAAGAFLWFSADSPLSIGNETLKLSGKLFSLTNVSWTGPIVLSGSSSEIEISYFKTPFIFTHSGIISGSGQLKKSGSGRLVLAGNSANTYSGGTQLLNGELVLSKSLGNAIPGDLTNSGGFLVLGNSEQIADSASVTMNAIFDLGARTETIGSLTGANGQLKFALGTLTTGGNNASTTFQGLLTGYGNTSLIKNGIGNFTLINSPPAYNPDSLDGDIAINAGTLTVGGVQLGTVTVNSGGLLQGEGSVGNVVLNGGKIHLSALHTASLTSINSASQIIDDFQGKNQFGQLKATGTVNLSGMSFLGLFTYSPFTGDSFLLLDNDGTDAILGNFSGLPEGASLVINGRTFVITYHGGDGNDIALTLTAGGLLPPVVSACDFHVIPGPTMHNHLEITSPPNVALKLQYSSDLNTWLNYPGQSTTSNAQGQAVFDFNDSVVTKRFYRVSIP